MGKLKKESGITLIALVVTIIVLLILAGISISMITGENGILKKAGEASEKTKIATEEEQRGLARYEAAANFENTVYTDSNGEQATIPAGFAPTRIEGESLINEGLVITDSEGNEFVWIPCEYSNEEKNGNADAVIYNADSDNGDNRNNEWKSCQNSYDKGKWYDEQPKTVGKKSIKRYHGFYVARYEAGVPKDAPFYASKEGDAYYDDSGRVEYNGVSDHTKAKNTSNYIPVSKKENQAWNFITQKNAKEVAEKMLDTVDVKSYLIDSHAWNTICRVIAKRDKTKDLTNSTNFGNYLDNIKTKYEGLEGLWAYHDNGNGEYNKALVYKTSTLPEKKKNTHIELSTGMSEDFKAYNIYDLAGNMWEWTTETGGGESEFTCMESNCDIPDNEKKGVLRGGCFHSEGDEDAVVRADGSQPLSRVSQNTGFRVILYLK